MLNLKLCFVDPGPFHYSVNSLYNQPLPRTQVSLLYLVSALAVRPNQVTVLSRREHAETQGELTLLPYPEDLEAFWNAQDFDLIVVLNRPDLAVEIRPHIQDTPLLLWMKVRPEHVAAQAFQDEALDALWTAYVFDSASQRQEYLSHFALSYHKCHYRWPGIIRSLRKRFMSSDELKDKRPQDRLVLAYTMLPEYGLKQICEIYRDISQSVSELSLKILLPPDYVPEHDTRSHQQLLQACRESDDIEVLEGLPWTAYVEHLLEVHIVCNLLDCKLPNGDSMMDALAAGCALVASRHPSLEEVSKDHCIWVDMEPLEDYAGRYTRRLLELITAHREDPETMVKRGFRQMAEIQTYFTWDLRVWEWESLFFQLAVCSDFTVLPDYPEQALASGAGQEGQ